MIERDRRKNRRERRRNDVGGIIPSAKSAFDHTDIGLPARKIQQRYCRCRFKGGQPSGFSHIFGVRTQHIGKLCKFLFRNRFTVQRNGIAQPGHFR